MVCGQLEKIMGTWITENQNLIQIVDTAKKGYSNNYITQVGIPKFSYKVYFNNDTLNFKANLFSLDTSISDNTLNYKFKIEKLTDTFLYIKPLTKESLLLYNSDTLVKFTRQELTKDTTIKFEKLIFHTSFCFGDCPTYHLEINSKKGIKLYAEEVFKEKDFLTRDKSKEGYFTGQLSESKFSKLIDLIRTCNLKTLELDSNNCCDGSLKTFIFYYNGQRKYYQTMFEHPIIGKLVDFLYNICEMSSKLKRTTTKFEIEK